MSELAVEMREVDAGYNGRAVLHAVSLRVQRCEIVALIGPNGAGKTTALKVIFGSVHRLHGSLTVLGEEAGNMGPVEMTAMGVSYVPQGGRVFSSLTVDENLSLAGEIACGRGHSADALDSVYGLFPSLKSKTRVLTGLLSAGERQMVALGRGFVLGTSLLLIDEPTGGLAPALAATVIRALLEMRDRGGRTLVIVEQNTGYALEAADRVYGLNLGRMQIEGVPKASVTADSLRQLYV